MSWLTVKFAKTRHILTRIYLIWLKIVIKQIEISLMPNFNLNGKIGKTVAE